MKPTFFKSAGAFRAWLKKNHETASEIAVGYYKAGSGKQNMTWSQSVDEALCFGWIDGVRNSIDEERYQIRFTPRRENSIWSSVNIKKVEQLKKQGLMEPAGLAIFTKRKKVKSAVYTHENEEKEFSKQLKDLFKANKIAWKFFQGLSPSYQKLSKNWVMGAKQENTQLKRIELIIKESAQGRNPWKGNKYKKS